MRGRVAKAIAFSSLEFLFLLGVWMLFVSQLQRAEFVAGVGAALLGAVADGVVKAKRLAKFRPRARWLALFALEPGYVLSGSAAVLWALVRRVAGKKSEAQFKVVPFRGGGDDAESVARRALAITLTTVSPDLIVVGIDKQRDFMLVHEISPAGTPFVTKQTGATG